MTMDEMKNEIEKYIGDNGEVTTTELAKMYPDLFGMFLGDGTIYPYLVFFDWEKCMDFIVEHLQTKNIILPESPKTASHTDSYDPVSRPSHYTEGRKYEPRKVIADWGLNFNLGNAVKYISRAGRKKDKIEDLRKAIQYIEFEIEESDGCKKNDKSLYEIFKDLPKEEQIKIQEGLFDNAFKKEDETK